MSVKTRYLHYYTVVSQAIDKWIGKPLCHDVVVIVVGMMVYVKYRFLNVTNLVTKYIYCYHRQGEAIPVDILGIGIVHSKILPETESLCLKPRFLQFNKYQFLLSVSITDSSTEVYAEHRQCIAVVIAVFVGAHLYGKHLYLEQGRKDSTGYALVLHQVLEHYVIYGIGYCHIIT